MSTLAFMYASLLAGAVAPTPAHAQGPAHAPGASALPVMAHVAVKTIHAKDAKEESTAPAALTKRLTMAFPKYTAFHLLGSAKWDLAKGATGTHELPNKQALKVKYLGPQDDFLKLQVAIPPKLKTDVRVKNGGTFYQAGMDYNGGILILSINAETKPAAN